MGGFKVYPATENKINYEKSIYADLPTRIAVLRAIDSADAYNTLLEGTIYTCKHCLTSKITRKAFLECLKQTLEWLNSHPNWGRDDKGKWHDPNLDTHTVAKNWITYAIEIISKWNCEYVYIEDYLMDTCEHEFIDFFPQPNTPSEVMESDKV